MMFAVRRLQELARKKGTPPFIRCIALTEAYDSVDRSLLWTVLARFGVLSRMLTVTRQLNYVMQARVWLDDGEAFL